MWKILYILFCIKMDFYLRCLLSVVFQKLNTSNDEALRSELVLLKLRRLVFWRLGGVFEPLPPPPGCPQREDPSGQEDHGDDGEVAAVDDELRNRSTSEIQSANFPRQSRARTESSRICCHLQLLKGDVKPLSTGQARPSHCTNQLEGFRQSCSPVGRWGGPGPCCSPPLR